MAKPSRPDEGGYRLHDDDSERTELIAASIAQRVSNEQRAKLRPKTRSESHLDEKKVPKQAREGDESVEP